MHLLSQASAFKKTYFQGQHIGFILMLIRTPYTLINFVGLLGFEPRMTGPESVVLPLHHKPLIVALVGLKPNTPFWITELKSVASINSAIEP